MIRSIDGVPVFLSRGELAHAAFYAPADLLAKIRQHLKLTPVHSLSLHPDDWEVLSPLLAVSPPPPSEIECPDCRGTGQYVGAGFFPAEVCRRCNGTKRVRKEAA